MIENIDDCLELVLQKHFFIQDEDGSSSAFIKYDNGQFEVKNDTDNNISFMKIDSCLEFKENYQKCDCAIFNDDVFCFIELKTLESDKSTIKSKRRKKAENQLQYTIENFQDEDIIKNKKLEAYVSLTCNRDDKLTEIPNISNKDKELEFIEDFKTRLYYKCKKEFN